MATAAATQPIELRIRDIGQLFQSLDPLPYRERDLDEGVEEYIVGWAREMHGDGDVEIVVRLPPAEAERQEAGQVADAIRHYFDYRAEVTSWELKELFRVGRLSLATGLAVLAVCVTAAQLLGRVLGEGHLSGVFREGLVIVGWVANWRPLEIFLYDWLPLVRRRRLYRRLAKASVRLAADLPDGAPAAAAAP